MSASVEVSSPVAVSTPSSKKRKHAGSSEKSAKKRRHVDEDWAEREADNVVAVPESAMKDKKKKKKKRNAEETAVEEHEQFIEQQEPESQRTIPQSNDTNGIDVSNEDGDQSLLDSGKLTSFSSVRISLNLPLPAVGLSNPKSSVLALHIAPLLLTYYAPAGGIVLAYTDAVLSNRPDSDADQSETITTRMGEELGSSWAWLTVTLLVFKPQPGDELSGWTNALSEGFIGLVSYNYFQTAVAQNRIPSSWSWTGAYQAQKKQRKTPRKGRLNDDQRQETFADSQETAVEQEYDETAVIDDFAGSFVDESGAKIPDTLNFRVLDIEMVPAHERGRWTLQIDGTLLDETEEARVRGEELRKVENRQNGTRSRSQTPGTPGTSGGGMPFMSGGMGPESRAASPAESQEPGPEPESLEP